MDDDLLYKVQHQNIGKLSKFTKDITFFCPDQEFFHKRLPKFSVDVLSLTSFLVNHWL